MSKTRIHVNPKTRGLRFAANRGGDDRRGVGMKDVWKRINTSASAAIASAAGVCCSSPGRQRVSEQVMTSSRNVSSTQLLTDLAQFRR